MQNKAVLFMMVIFLLATGTTALAHGGGEAPVDVKSLVKQSIAFIEGIEDMDMALAKLDEAIDANKKQQVADGELLQEAKQSLEAGNNEEAMLLMVEAIGGDPLVDLELAPSFQFNLANIILLIIAIISVFIGILLLRQKADVERGANNE
ncbi:hypothetical protein BHF71_09550 [Vulcanibacillus modesticaldus]|uniref:Uncharacterized protein n=1 Tax=Vulcanibacillus modesticaldus TaxID=337097 RepID=A0A1D2YU68_9BACI|nr:hypothetical protein [Vulcanibacillus modesticaldus]OEF99226.1 hypothetical protein BHF71_09550 [Vulcanibacillus modesticaldus]